MTYPTSCERLITSIYYNNDGTHCCEWFDPETGFVSRFYGTREQCLEEAARFSPSDPLWIEASKIWND